MSLLQITMIRLRCMAVVAASGMRGVLKAHLPTRKILPIMTRLTLPHLRQNTYFPLQKTIPSWMATSAQHGLPAMDLSWVTAVITTDEAEAITFVEDVASGNLDRAATAIWIRARL